MRSVLRLHYAPDNASLCIRLALEELHLPYATVLVDRAGQAQRSLAFLALNPNGLIPVLETPHGPLFETGAILLWLADQYGGLMPASTDPGRGAALKWLFWLSNTLHATERMLFYPGQYAKGGPVMERAILTQTKARLTDQLTILAQARDADWLDADAPNALACYLAPLLRWPVFYGDEPGWLDLSHWPRLLAFAQRFEQRPAAVTATMAERLGDTPFSAPQTLNPLGIGPSDP
jgi:glutathione S-transferase